LTGHSGAGKSSILSLILAEQKPNVGDVRVSGFPVTRLTTKQIPKLRRKLGVVFHRDSGCSSIARSKKTSDSHSEVTGTRREGIPDA
jgi:cell division transport system ATP-binding protein